MDYREALLRSIDRLIAGGLTVPKFRDEYYDFYLETVPDDALSDRDSEFFGLVQEMLDWTTSDPPKVDKEAGWMDYEEYLNWLEERRSAYGVRD